jgi:hypothetical protein
MGWAHEGDVWTVPPGREAHATKAVSDELKASKVNGFTKGEATARQTFTINGNDEHWWENHQNVQRKSALQIPLLCMPTVGVSYTGKI